MLEILLLCFIMHVLDYAIESFTSATDTTIMNADMLITA